MGRVALTFFFSPKGNWKFSPNQRLCVCVCVCVCVIAQSWPTICDPMECSLLGSSIHGIPQARMLEWVAIPFSRGSSQHRDQTLVSHVADRFFTVWATREAQWLCNPLEIELNWTLLGARTYRPCLLFQFHFIDGKPEVQSEEIIDDTSSLLDKQCNNLISFSSHST